MAPLRPRAQVQAHADGVNQPAVMVASSSLRAVMEGAGTAGYFAARSSLWRHFGYSFSISFSGHVPYHGVPVRRSRSISANAYFFTPSRPAKTGLSVPTS